MIRHPALDNSDEDEGGSDLGLIVLPDASSVHTTFSLIAPTIDFALQRLHRDFC